MRLPHWIGRELDAWQRDGLISDEQHRLILGRYEPPAEISAQLSYTLITLAILAAGTGVVVFLERNWNVIPPAARLVIASGSVAAAFVAATSRARAGRIEQAEWLALLGGLFCGGAIFVGAEVFHLAIDDKGVLMLWSIALAATAVLTPSPPAAGVAAAVAVWEMLIASPKPPAPWMFLLAWPMLAAAVERRDNRYAAGAVAIAFGCWTFFVTLTVWGDRSGTPVAFVVALLAGAWLDALAHSAGRRPAFARGTPALAVILLALVWLLTSGVHRDMHDWRAAALNPWPIAVLIASLVTMVVRFSLSAGARQSRPLVIALASIVWLIVWLVVPEASRTAIPLQWFWIALFSCLMGWIGSQAIRDGITTGDRGIVGLGVIAILLLVFVRAVDAKGLPALQVALLVGLGVFLFWLARRGRRATSGADVD